MGTPVYPGTSHKFSEVSTLIPVCLFKTVNSGEKNKEKVEIITKLIAEMKKRNTHTHTHKEENKERN